MLALATHCLPRIAYSHDQFDKMDTTMTVYMSGAFHFDGKATSAPKKHYLCQQF